MFWIERMLGVDLGILSWVGDFSLLLFAVMMFAGADGESRWQIVGIVVLGILVFGFLMVMVL